VEFEYFEGYPGRYRGDLRDGLGNHLLTCLPLLLLSGSGAALFGYQAWLAKDWNGSFSLWFLLGWALLFLYLFFDGFRRGTVRITPKFARRVDAIRHYGRGFAIAPAVRELDARCRVQQLEPFSTFGFDDRHAEIPRWHAPERGLAVIEGLLESIEQRGLDGVEHSKPLTEDLKRLASMLRVAVQHQVEFRLVLRQGGSPPETSAS